MREYTRTAREAEQFDDVEEQELADYLHELAPHIGWVVIYFNALEDTVAFCLRDLMLRDPYQDERLDAFLAEMLFAAKATSLVNLYGQAIAAGGLLLQVTQEDLVGIEKLLKECAKRRNEYAHADWIGARRERIVRVKSQSKKIGIVHRYKRFNPADVDDDVRYIDVARDTLYEFHDRLMHQLHFPHTS